LIFDCKPHFAKLLAVTLDTHFFAYQHPNNVYHSASQIPLSANQTNSVDRSANAMHYTQKIHVELLSQVSAYSVSKAIKQSASGSQFTSHHVPTYLCQLRTSSRLWENEIQSVRNQKVIKKHILFAYVYTFNITIQQILTISDVMNKERWDKIFVHVLPAFACLPDFWNALEEGPYNNKKLKW